ncbi:hypothetical protein [Salinibaculum marinum]
MAERAELARQRADGRYDLSRARWGGTNAALAAVSDGTPPAELPVEWRHWRAGVDFAALVADLDYLATSVCYRVGESETTVFLSLWFGVPLVDESANPGAGALVAVDSLDDARAVRAAFRAFKGALADALTAGDLPPVAAPCVISAWLRGLAARETHVAPPFPPPERLNGMGRPDGT